MILGGSGSLVIKVIEVELKERKLKGFHDGYVQNKCREKRRD